MCILNAFYNIHSLSEGCDGGGGPGFAPKNKNLIPETKFYRQMCFNKNVVFLTQLFVYHEDKLANIFRLRVFFKLDLPKVMNVFSVQTYIFPEMSKWKSRSEIL